MKSANLKLHMCTNLKMDNVGPWAHFKTKIKKDIDFKK